MKTTIFFTILCLALAFNLNAQKRVKKTLPDRAWQDLIKDDSIFIYVGVENRFKKPTKDAVHLDGPVEGLDIDDDPGMLTFIPRRPGVFDVNFKSTSGIRHVVLVSKILPPPAEFPGN